MMLRGFDTILLDMNGTFMFGHDCFGNAEDYGRYFREIGGTLPGTDVRAIIEDVMGYLEPRYPDPEYRENFPTIDAALSAVLPEGRVCDADRNRLVATFAYHECGTIPPEYRQALLELASVFRVGLVADIWAPKDIWLDEFERAGVRPVFGALSFSSDHGMVKPSPKPFLRVLRQLGGDPAKTVIIGDSVRRDLGGAIAAGLPCILVGGAEDRTALGAVGSLLDLV